MPFDAALERFAPPAKAVAVAADAKVPTVRTGATLSTRKSAGNDAGAAVPMPSKFCAYGVVVEMEIEAYRTYVAMRTAVMVAKTVSSLRMGAQILADSV